MEPWFFEDFAPGQTLPPGDVVVDEVDAAWFASRFGRPGIDARLWTDPAREGDGLSGWHVAALGMRLIYDAFLSRTASLGAPGIEELEWPHPVLAGDRLRFEGQVSSLRPSRSRPEMGLVGFVITLFNQQGQCVMRQSNVILVQRRTQGAET